MATILPMVANAQFWQSTRGRLVTLLRGAVHGVAELAQRLGLTENAVRAHLLTLQRDGLVRLSGQRRGNRRPSYTYELTDQADQLFPKPYAPVLAEVLAALRGRVPADQRRELLQEAGTRLAEAHAGEFDHLSLDDRLDRVGKLLDSMGGNVTLLREEGSIHLRGTRCPLSRVIHATDDSDACEIMRAMLQRLLGADVVERCERGNPPRCCFEVATRSSP